jgi:hypothetical protein
MNSRRLIRATPDRSVYHDPGPHDGRFDPPGGMWCATNVHFGQKRSCEPGSTKWKGAPWEWLFSNPKKTGYCDRWGYKLTLLTDKENARAVCYHVVKK